MTLIDRYILMRFTANFAILFTLIFIFAATIDLILALDTFAKVARGAVGEDAGLFRFLLTFTGYALDFQSPRFFQFYAYLHGLTAVGAMGFTLAQMHRHRELVAMLAAGISMHRIAMPFVVGMFILSIAQLLNQEMFLPRVAPLLLREHGNIGQRSVEEFPVRFTPDGAGSLLLAPAFNPQTGELHGLTILERDDLGRTTRRITADTARWAEMTQGDGGEVEGWMLSGGEVVTLQPGAVQAEGGAPQQPISFYPTDLSPHMLLVRRYREYAAMLSLQQIQEMLDTPGLEQHETLQQALLRYRYGRFSSVLINILVMWLTLPTFLLRQPANLLFRSLMCAGIALPAMLGAAIFMMMSLPGIPPAVGVFLPVVVLLPVVLAQWTYVRT